MGYLTPDTIPADTICRVLIIPNDQRMIANVTGALELLTFAENWDAFGAQTPADSAAAMLPMFNDFCFKRGSCKMIGEIVCWSGVGSPDPKWLACDGSAVNIADYPDLYAIIGTIYGSPGAGQFNLPDLTDRTPAGIGVNALGTPYGEASHTLITAETPSHTHSDTGHTHAESAAVASVGAAITGVPVPSAIPIVGVTGVGIAILTSTGGDGAHNNLGPRLAINFLIVALE